MTTKYNVAALVKAARELVTAVTFGGIGDLPNDAGEGYMARIPAQFAETVMQALAAIEQPTATTPSAWVCKELPTRAKFGCIYCADASRKNGVPALPAGGVSEDDNEAVDRVVKGGSYAVGSSHNVGSNPAPLQPTPPTTPINAADAEANNLLAMTDEQIWADAVREYGSPEKALAEAERIRNIIKRVTDETCPKVRDILAKPTAPREAEGVVRDALRAAIENGLECYSAPCSDDSGDIVVHIQQTVDEIYKRVAALMQSPAREQVTEERPYPQLLSDEEKQSLLKKAEELWSALQDNNLGGFSGINRPFLILHEFREAIEQYGNRDTGLTWSVNDLRAASVVKGGACE